MAGSLLSAMRLGLSNTLGQFRRVYTNPAQPGGGSVTGLQPYYALLWQYYENSAFENLGSWASYKGQHRLYRQMRMIYNPARRLADFYSGHVYPGLLAADETGLPEGTTLAIP